MSSEQLHDHFFDPSFEISPCSFKAPQPACVCDGVPAASFSRILKMNERLINDNAGKNPKQSETTTSRLPIKGQDPAPMQWPLALKPSLSLTSPLIRPLPMSVPQWKVPLQLRGSLKSRFPAPESDCEPCRHHRLPTAAPSQESTFVHGQFMVTQARDTEESSDSATSVQPRGSLLLSATRHQTLDTIQHPGVRLANAAVLGHERGYEEQLRPSTRSITAL